MQISIQIVIVYYIWDYRPKWYTVCYMFCVRVCHADIKFITADYCNRYSALEKVTTYFVKLLGRKYRAYLYKWTPVFEQQQMIAKILCLFVKISYTGNPGHIVLHALHNFKLFWFQENNFWKIHKINFIVHFYS